MDSKAAVKALELVRGLDLSIDEDYDDYEVLRRMVIAIRDFFYNRGYGIDDGVMAHVYETVFKVEIPEL